MNALSFCWVRVNWSIYFHFFKPRGLSRVPLTKVYSREFLVYFCESRRPVFASEDASLTWSLGAPPVSRLAPQSPQKEPPQRRFLSCPAALTVTHLQKFIRKKYDLGLNYEVSQSFSQSLSAPSSPVSALWLLHAFCTPQCSANLVFVLFFDACFVIFAKLAPVSRFGARVIRHAIEEPRRGKGEFRGWEESAF